MRAACVFAAVCLLWLCAPLQAVAQQKPDPTIDLTLERALELAAERHPKVRAALADIAIARGQRTAAGLSPYDPTVEAEAGPRLGDETTVNVHASVGQWFELGGKAAARTRAAAADVLAAEARAADVARRELAQVAATFLRAAHARQRLEVAGDVQALTAEVLEAARARQEAGEVGALDVNLARLAAGRTGVELETWRARLEARTGELKAALRVAPTARLTLADGPAGLEPLAAAELVERLEARADLVRLRAELEAAEAQLAVARAERWPDLGVKAGYGHEEGAHIVTAGLAVSLPLFSHGQGLAEVAKARAQKAREQLAARRDQARAELAAAIDRYERLRQARQRFADEVLPVLADNERMTRQAYEAGALGLADLLTVRRELVEAREAFADLALEVALARNDVRRIAGDLPTMPAPTHGETR